MASEDEIQQQQSEATEPAESTEAVQPTEEPKRPFAFLRHPLTVYQTIIGIGAGLLTISGTVGSMVGFSYRTPQAELMTTVHNARSRVPISGATIEIRTPTDAIVTTLTADGDGRAQYKVREGAYNLRITHPHYLPDVKQVQVQGGQIADIRVALRMPVRLPAPPKPIPPVPEKEPNFLERLFSSRS
jgi:hypothetical protein